MKDVVNSLWGKMSFDFKKFFFKIFTVAPHITPFAFDDGPVNAGDSVQLNCYVPKGDKPLRIEWHFHGYDTKSHALGISTSMFGDRSNILSINAVGPGHQGEFTCVASNLAGIANYSAILNVNGISNFH